jgi:hypothetical protein
MEDLGNININIRESRMGSGGGGSGGGGGATGGGPGRAPLPSGGGGGGGGGSGLSWMDRLESFLGIGSAARGIAAAPSVSAFLGGAAPTGAIATGLVAVGPALSALAPIVAGVAVAFGAVTIAIKKLQFAAERTAERIEAVGRYSATITAASSMEKIAALQRNISEAARNANEYARAQRSATIAADAWAPTLAALNRGLAGVAPMFNFMSKFVADRLAVPSERFAEMGVAYGIAIPAAISSMQRTVEQGWQGTKSFLTDLLGETPLGAWLEKLLADLTKLLEFLGLIEANTKPKPPPPKLNDWFMSDIRAMTGRPY